MFDPATAAEILGAAPAALGDDDLTTHLLAAIALAERATAAVLAAIGEFDVRDQWALDGAVGPAPWLAARAQLSSREARGLVGAAQALRRTTAVASALAEGALNVGQAKALAFVRTTRTSELFDTHEPISWRRPGPSASTTPSAWLAAGRSRPTPTGPPPTTMTSRPACPRPTRAGGAWTPT